MSIDLKQMLKVYNYVNDEKRQKLNVKFLGLVGVLVVVGVAFGAWLLVQGSHVGAGPSAAASQSKHEYVGLSGAEAQAGMDSGVIQDRLASWRAAHPEAVVDRMDPMYFGGLLVGYDVYYHEPSR